VRSADPGAKVVVVDLFRFRTRPEIDAISSEIDPDQRVIPSSDSVILHRLYQAPMTMIITPDQRYGCVELGVLSTASIQRLLAAVKKVS
jgi:hypothetical protein